MGMAGSAGSMTYPGSIAPNNGKTVKYGDPGYNGRSGKPGRSGSNGSDGQWGIKGSDGSVEYILFHPLTGEILESSSKLYFGEITRMKVTPLVDDSILEPGEDVFIEEIHFKNTGGISFPPNLEFRLIGDFNFHFSEEHVMIVDQAIPPFSSVTLPIRMKGKIGAKQGEARFRITFDFQKKFPHIRMDDKRIFNISGIQYPISMHPVAPLIVSHGENTFHMHFENHSSFSYGNSTENGDLTFRIEMQDEENRILMDGKAIFTGNIENIEGKQVSSAEIPFTVLENLDFYKIIAVKLELFLRNEKIQTENTTLKPIPIYNFQQKENDVLLLISSSLSEKQFKSLHEAFNRLKITYNIWDFHFYNSFLTYQCPNTHETREAPWMKAFQNKLIILFVDEIEQINLLPVGTIYSHFYSEEGRMLSSSLLLFGDLSRNLFVNYLFSDEKYYRASPVDKEALGDWYSLYHVTETFAHQKITEIQTQWQVEDPFHVKKVINFNYSPSKLKSHIVKTFWSYGSADLAESVFSSVCKIRFISNYDRKHVYSVEELIPILFESFPLPYEFLCLHDAYSNNWPSQGSMVPFIEYFRSFLDLQISKNVQVDQILAAHLQLLSNLISSITHASDNSGFTNPVIITEALIMLYRLNSLFSKKSFFRAFFAHTLPISDSNRVLLHAFITSLENLLPNLQEQTNYLNSTSQAKLPSISPLTHSFR